MKRSIFFLLSLCAATANAAWDAPSAFDTWLEDKDERGVFVVDGSFVHDIGELQLNITNWGLIGSKPLLDAPYSNAPSAMWPAGSGVDHLYAAGLWVGGVKNGVPLVSTGQLETEFLPTSHPLDTLYEMRAGDFGGARYPYPGEDDDDDGLVNEEVVDGYDDDQDGEIDEDYARIGDQQFRCRFSDTEPVIQELHPDHDPLGLEVVQESYQWDSPRLDDVVVLDYTLRNVGSEVIDGLAVGFFADPDIGPRNGGRISEDDLVGRVTRRVRARDGSFVDVDLAYMSNCERSGRDGGGIIGFMFVNRGIQSFRYFVGNSSFERGGDPNTDEERYEVMMGGVNQDFPDDCRQAGDYRFVIATRAGGLSPRQAFRFQVAIVMGEDLDDLVANAVEVSLTAYGQWFDRDGNPLTGVQGRETRLCQHWFGPPGPDNPIFQFVLDCAHAFEGGELPPNVSPDDLDAFGCTWINGDCGLEALRGAADSRCRDEQFWPEDLLGACTGVRGREHHVAWLAARPPPRPHLRAWADDNRVHLFWSSRAEEERDLRWNLSNFESYRVWRADDWRRPLGSSVETGPGSEQWNRLAEFDVVSTYLNEEGEIVENLPLGPNTGLGMLAYTPAVVREGSAERREFEQLRRLVVRINSDHPGLDPNTLLRYRDARGVVTDFGREYPSLSAWECCTAQIDTLFWHSRGRRFYKYTDDTPLNGLLYFYSVTATTVTRNDAGRIVGYGAEGRPLSNFVFVVPQSPAQTLTQRAELGQNVYVVPNPATRAALAEFSPLDPNQDDPTGVRIEFRNLPRAINTVSIFTLSGDRVVRLRHDGRQGHGSLPWNLISRNGQEIVSGIYLYTVESDDPGFERVVGRFVVIR